MKNRGEILSKNSNNTLSVSEFSPEISKQVAASCIGVLIKKAENMAIFLIFFKNLPSVRYL